MKHFRLSFFQNLHWVWAKKSLARVIEVSQKRISRATTYKKKLLHSESSPYIYTKRKTRCDALSDDTQKDDVIKLTAALASSDRRCFAFLIVSFMFSTTVDANLSSGVDIIIFSSRICIVGDFVFR
jgi:hypothetical protein